MHAPNQFAKNIRPSRKFDKKNATLPNTACVTTVTKPWTEKEFSNLYEPNPTLQANSNLDFRDRWRKFTELKDFLCREFSQLSLRLLLLGKSDRLPLFHAIT